MTHVFLSSDRVSRASSEFKSKYLSYLAHDPAAQFIENSHLKLAFDTDTGLLNSVVDKKNGNKQFGFTQRVRHTNRSRMRSSGRIRQALGGRLS